jgi:hypothetical protein
MNRWWLVALSGFALIAAGVGAALRPAPEAARATEVQALEFSMLTPAGRVVELHFTVRAAGGDEAYDAAMAAAAALIPGGTMAGDSGHATAAYAFWPWKWADELLPVPVAYNPAGAPAGVTAGDVLAGIEPWNAVEASAFRIAYAGTTAAAPGIHDDVLDGQNVIGWLDLECTEGCVLGVTTKSPDAYEVDIALNSNALAGLGSDGLFATDTASVVLHEVGHLAGLEHSCQPVYGSCTPSEESAVMFPRYKGMARSLAADDIAGIAALYPAQDEPAPAQETRLVVDLETGWNLVLLPPGPIEESVGGLRCVDAIYTLDGDQWLVWLRDAARPLNSLASTQGARSYWVHSQAPCVQTFTVAQTP